MATVSINIPDTIAPRVLTAFANTYGYQAQIPDPNNPGQTIANPVTEAQFAKTQLISHIKDVIYNYESSLAVQTALTDAMTNIDTDITLS